MSVPLITVSESVFMRMTVTMATIVAMQGQIRPCRELCSGRSLNWMQPEPSRHAWRSDWGNNIFESFQTG